MKRWKIVYEKYCKAVDRLYSTVQPYLNYNIVCDREVVADTNIIYIGLDKEMEGYRIHVSKPENEVQRIDIIGRDEIQLLYAASDFRNVYLPYARNCDGRTPLYFTNQLFKGPMKEYELVTKPRIKNRGIWTWGYVIYDYKKFIDNMVTLKLNTLIVWNDYVPSNINDVISYAHENGVRIYLGFAWGWDAVCAESDTILRMDEVEAAVLEIYECQYKNLQCDGIYFQSFTEVNDDTLNGVVVADAVTDFVNRTAGKLLEKNKELKLIFGLHATSVKNRLDVIQKVDNRIMIMWEDAGAFPYQYLPCDTDGFGETVEFTRKIQNLREGDFGVVLKGVTCLDWYSFEHQKGEFVLGVADDRLIKQKFVDKRSMLKHIQAYWIINAKYAHEMIKELNEDTMVTVLAEDCVFEEVINYPVALYAQMLWDCNRSTEEILCETALMTDVVLV